MAISLMDYVSQSPQEMLRGLVQKITNESVFMPLLRFITVDGFSYEYGEQATLGSISFRSLNEQYSADSGIVNPKVETLSIFGGEIDTDHQIVNKQGGKARANSIAAKVKKAGLFFDKYFLQGDPAVNKKQFTGLNARITGKQMIYAGANGAALELAMVDELLDAVVGTNDQKWLVMNKQARRQLKNKRQTAAGGTAAADIGVTYDNYDRARILVIDEDGDEQPILAQNEIRGAGTTCTSMYCIRPGTDTDGEYLQGLVSNEIIQHYESGMRGNMHVDVIECHAGIALFHGRAAARLGGILPTTAVTS